MLGAIIGDIVGSTRERRNVKSENFELVPAWSRFTDDTVMTLAVARWLMEDPDHQSDTLVGIMQEMGRLYPHAGYGGLFRKWLKSDNPQPYGSYGNGSAMRVSPVGLYARSLDEALHLAVVTASVTHNHPEGIKGAQAIAACIYMHRHKEFYTKSDIKKYTEEHFGYNLNIRLEDIRDSYTFDSSCQGSVPIAIMAYLQREHPLDVLRLAISMGGDSDTIGCMAMSIALADADLAPGYMTDDNLLHVIAQCNDVLNHHVSDINERFEAFITDVHSGDNRIRDRIRGSLMAGAAGDALGYPVEFMSLASILSRYGADGITRFDTNPAGKALVSDDTQMTLFTAAGMLMGLTRGYMRGIGGQPERYVDGAYIDWYFTQTGKKSPFISHDDFHYTWLRDLPELAHRRAPGNTCLNACESLLNHRQVKNNSKGCGGIMRVAPMGLLDAAFMHKFGRGIYPRQELARAGAEIAGTTHLHPLGYLPAAMLTILISRIISLSIDEIKHSITDIVGNALDLMMKIDDNDSSDDKQLLRALTLKAIDLARSNCPDSEAITLLGEGWTAEEAWAISLFCVLRHIDDTEAAIIAAVNHDGDSDSTGSITGNIMGAIYGYEALKRQRIFCPEGKTFEDTLELHNIILAIADDLYSGCIISECDPLDTPEKQQWYDRYCMMQPSGLR
ncbi:MAG: ADP-ribosylglycohydrolase family protein [Duncaniella sp.]|nr:ADP-ribosylglycohydrolase family protein [Duncaniella sp.]